MSPPNAAIRFEGVAKVFDRGDGREPVHAVRDLDLEVADGECLCLIGTSGCGKTTILRLVNRLLEPTRGRVLVGGVDVATLDPIALRRSMGYVIQSGGLFPHMTVAGNVGLLCRLEGWESERARARVAELLERVHLPADEFADRYPSALSGGQRQRVGVARALALDPRIVLLDEPFGALDRITRARVQEEFLELRKSEGRTMILVSHDLDEARRLGDRIGIMSEGTLLQVGTWEELSDAPATGFVARFVQEVAGA